MVLSTGILSTFAFPTGVGMNRDTVSPASLRAGVPHGRGDEPFSGLLSALLPLAFPTGVGMNLT